MSAHQQRRWYTDDELATIIEHASRGDVVETVVAAYRPFGVDLRSESQERIAASDFAIPEFQWRDICSALTKAPLPRDAIGAVNRGLDWVNLGPSAFDAEPTTV